MKISIIIPLYNKAIHVQRTLNSVLAQTWDEFEVIVVDDGSTDGGGDVVAQNTDSRIRLIRQRNSGPAMARNRGIGEAKGAYIAFLDADDEWLPEFLQTNMAQLENLGPDVATISSGYFYHPSGHSTEAMWQERGLKDGVFRISAETEALFTVHLLAYISPWNTIARIEILRRYGGFCRRGKCLYGEDSFLWLKVLLNHAVAVNMKPMVRYHSEASALSRNIYGARPVEPILLYPEDIREQCPPQLKGLLADVLAIRAAKTACMLSYWGRWREARSLLRQFCPSSSLRHSQVRTAQLCATPLGAVAGSAHRLLARMG